jgi:FdhD protein
MNDGMIERLFRLRSIASGCGQESATVFDGPLPPNPAIPYLRADTVLRSMKEFLRSSEAYGRTHGVHSAGLYTVEGERMAFFEEIGRHNAVDKVMGFAAKKGVPLGGTMLLSTGRLSSEIVQKAAAGPVPAIVSRAAPTSRSVEMARRQNILMVGRVRGSGFIVYHGAERIVC